MLDLGIILALNHAYGAWTLAGIMNTVYVLSMSCVTPLYAKAFDRFGQARVGRPTLALQVVFMLAFALAVWLRAPVALMFALAVLMGVTQFSFGALVRARWAYTLRDVRDGESLLNTAYATEAAIDEVVFILGPMLTAWLATSVHPVAQLFVPIAAAAIGGAVFFSLRSTQPRPVVEMVDTTATSDVPPVDGADGIVTSDADGVDCPDGRHIKRSALLYRGMLPLIAVFVVFNMSFTAVDVSITAAVKSMGAERFLGLQLAMYAVGSCIGALIFGSRRLRGSHWAHMVLFMSLLTVGFVLFRVTMDNLVVLAIVEVLTGLNVSPLFTTGSLIVRGLVPSESLTEGLSWLTTAGTAGGAIGSSVAGMVLDVFGAHGGMTLPALFTAAAIPLTLYGWLSSRRHVMPR
nr:MFS transporter [Bifidobacterium miconis]